MDGSLIRQRGPAHGGTPPAQPPQRGRPPRTKEQQIQKKGRLGKHGHTEAASTTAVAMIAYVGTASDCLHGLAIALADESGKYKYGEAVTACSGKAAVTGGTWRLPSEKDWQYMFIGCGSSESYSAPTWEMENSYSGLASKLATAQGEALQSDYYWSSTEYNSSDAWDFSFDEGKWFHSDKSIEDHVRACLAF